MAVALAAANSSSYAPLPRPPLRPPRAAAGASFPASRSRRTRPSSSQTAGPADAYSRFPPPRRRRATGVIRVSPALICAGADELPAPLLPNARRRGLDPLWHGGGFSLGVDLGGSRTGLAVGRGITLPRPLTVLKLRGQKLELMLLDIARQQEADELIVGLPLSADGSETPQSNKVRSVVGRLAVQAAERGLRVYLQDEHGTSKDALDFMISRGVKKSSRDVKSDAYAAVVVARFNEIVTNLLLQGALETFERYSVKPDNITVVSVPGSFEVPVTALKLGKSRNFDAILCIGAVIRGDTTHYDSIANSAASGVLSAGFSAGIPCVFGFLTCEDMDQALHRAGGKAGNKGAEAAITAIEMASLFRHHLG